jgi:hypothetical protein
MSLAFCRARSPRGQDRDKPLKFTPGFKDEKLLLDLNFSNPESMTTERNNEMVSGKSLKGFPYRCATKPRQLTQCSF